MLLALFAFCQMARTVRPARMRSRTSPRPHFVANLSPSPFRIPPALVEQLFLAAQHLHRVAPWKLAAGDRPLRVDIPALGVEGACFVLMGGLGESFGFLLFPSRAALDAFESASERLMRSSLGRGPIDLGTAHLALEFEQGAALSPAMRKEVARHGWPVQRADAYPVVTARERDGVLRPLEARDVQIAASCAGAVAIFAARNRQVFASEDAEPCCETIRDERADGAAVTLTAPYDAAELFEPPAPEAPQRTEPPAPKPARNAPCPCGSGKKYKLCHLPLDEAQSAPGARTQAIHALDRRLSSAVLDFAARRFGEPFVTSIRAGWSGDALQLAVAFGAFVMRIEGKTVLDRYLAERGKRLSSEERRWLEAQRAAWLSVWEATHVEPGVGLTLRDLLSGESRRVTDVAASQTVRIRNALLARVADHAGFSLLCGAHARTLPPRDAAQVADNARKRLRAKGAAPPAKLRDEDFYRYLAGAWERAVRKAERRAATPVDLRNTDGDVFLLTTDHFDFDASQRPALEERLAALDGVERDPASGGEEVFVFTVPGNRQHPSWENTIVGSARLAAASLRLETNSLERADALRARVEKACGGLLRHRARAHEDPLSQRHAAAPRARAPQPPEAVQLELELKARHYAEWLDQPVPALSGKTPREAATTAQGRAALDLLLKEAEQHEAAADPAAAYDVTQLRRELGLE